MWRDAALVAAKDIRIEARSRVTSMQVAPYALLVLLTFGFAFDQDHSLLDSAAPGLFWVAVVLCTLLAVQRSFSLESAEGVRDAIRLSGLDPAGIFLGKAGAIAAQLAALQVLLGGGVTVLFGTRLHGAALLLLSCGAATVGLAAAGTVYGMISAGLHVRETLLPLLVLPVVAPVVLAATQTWMAALRLSGTNGWKWLTVLGCFSAIYVALGVVAFALLVEDT